MTDELKRYAPIVIVNNVGALIADCVPHSNGEYVRFADVQAAIAAAVDREADTHRRYDAKLDAAEAKLAKAVDGLHAVVQHDASTFFGPECEKNKRASWRGVMRKVRATLAELEAKP